MRGLDKWLESGRPGDGLEEWAEYVWDLLAAQAPRCYEEELMKDLIRYYDDNLEECERIEGLLFNKYRYETSKAAQVYLRILRDRI